MRPRSPCHVSHSARIHISDHEHRSTLFPKRRAPLWREASPSARCSCALPVQKRLELVHAAIPSDDALISLEGDAASGSLPLSGAPAPIAADPPSSLCERRLRSRRGKNLASAGSACTQLPCPSIAAAGPHPGKTSASS